jgi:hypothetical protein
MALAALCVHVAQNLERTPPVRHGAAVLERRRGIPELPVSYISERGGCPLSIGGLRTRRWRLF